MERSFAVLRFDPEVDLRPRWQEYRIQVESSWSVLDCLNRIKWDLDGSLTFRRSCGHGVCGSDAMMINGRHRLACQTLLRTLGPGPVRVSPLKGFPVIRDLVVSMEPLYERNLAVLPWFVNSEPAGAAERRQSPAERARIDEASRCILCGSCTGACPTSWFDPAYLGPAALVKAHRFVFDSRDRAAADRLERLNDHTGPYKCHAVFNCVEACPKEIHVTRLISQLKRRVLVHALGRLISRWGGRGGEVR